MRTGSSPSHKATPRPHRRPSESRRPPRLPRPSPLPRKPRRNGTCSRPRNGAQLIEVAHDPDNLMTKLGSTIGANALCAAGVVAVAVPQPAYASDWGCQGWSSAWRRPDRRRNMPSASPRSRNSGTPSLSAARSRPAPGVGIKTKKAKHGYDLTVTQADGGTLRYALDTRYQTVTPQ